MKAPDKIYVDDLAVVNDCSTRISTKPLSYFSEYIRKDALMEWAEDFKARTGWYEIEVAMDDLIDKLNSM